MTISIRPLEPVRDAALIHAWVTHPRSEYWQMLTASEREVTEEYQRITDSPHHDAWLGYVDDEPAFLAETYDPFLATEVGLSELPDLQHGDLGMHVLVAPSDAPVHGFTRRVFTAVMEFCFHEPGVQRVVVEPDVRNDKIGTLNAEAGFVVARVIELPGKQAALSFCTREAFEAKVGQLA